MDRVQCSVFSVDFEENMVTFRVPPAVLERGIKCGHASIDFSTITGGRKTSVQGSAPQTSHNSAMDAIARITAVLDNPDTSDGAKVSLINIIIGQQHQ